MTRGNPTAFVRRMTRDDISAIVDLQSRVFAGMNPWKAETLARHLTIFPEGQVVAVDESGRVLGSLSWTSSRTKCTIPSRATLPRC